MAMTSTTFMISANLQSKAKTQLQQNGGTKEVLLDPGGCAVRGQTSVTTKGGAEKEDLDLDVIGGFGKSAQIIALLCPATLGTI